MTYKIAVATSDNKNVDLHFGCAESFKIYQVDGLEITFLEERQNLNSKENDGKNCNCGSNQNHSSCSQEEKIPSIDIVSDCRAVVCAKIGKNILRQLELHAISSFDIEMPVKEALEKISEYYQKIDNRLKSYASKKSC